MTTCRGPCRNPFGSICARSLSHRPVGIGHLGQSPCWMFGHRSGVRLWKIDGRPRCDWPGGLLPWIVASVVESDDKFGDDEVLSVRTVEDAKVGFVLNVNWMSFGVIYNVGCIDVQWENLWFSILLKLKSMKKISRIEMGLYILNVLIYF